MSVTYNITTDFSAKDSLPPNDPDRVVRGGEFTTEFENIKTAFQTVAEETKVDLLEVAVADNEASIIQIESDLTSSDSNIQNNTDAINALDSDVVKLTGNQSVGGQKTFQDGVIIQTSFTVDGSYLLGNLSAGDNVSFSGNEISSTDTTYTAGNGLQLVGGEFRMTGTYTGTFTATGNITAFSDARLKSDVKTIDPLKALDFRGVTYKYWDGNIDSGVIAQEVEQVAPELVHSENEYKSVNYFGLIGYLIETVKYLHKEVEELKNGSS